MADLKGNPQRRIELLESVLDTLFAKTDWKTPG